MFTINGITAFQAVVESVERYKVYFRLENESRGLMYAYDLPGYQADMACLFQAGQTVYVRKKEILYKGMVLVTTEGLTEKDLLEHIVGEERIGIACKTVKDGTLVQLSPCVSVFLWQVYLSENTKVIVSVQQNKAGKIKTYLSSVIYDDYIEETPIFTLTYKPMELPKEAQQAA